MFKYHFKGIHSYPSPITEEERATRETERQAREQAAMDELVEMDKAFEQPTMESPIDAMREPVAPESPTDLPPTEEPPVEPAPTPAPTEPSVEPTAPVEPTEPTEPAPTDEYDFEFLNELARNAVLRERGTATPPATAPTEPSVQAPQAQAPAAVPTPQQYVRPVETPPDLITAEELSTAINSEDQAGALLPLFQRVYQRAVVAATEMALTQLPTVSGPMMAQIATNIAIRDKFYKDNPDLDKARDFVQYCAMQVETKHPDWQTVQVLDEAAKLARSRMPALQRAKQAAAAQPTPSFATQQSGGKAKRPGQTQQLSALEKELADMPDTPY